MSAMNSWKPSALAPGISNVPGSFCPLEITAGKLSLSRDVSRVALTSMSLTAATAIVQSEIPMRHSGGL